VAVLATARFFFYFFIIYYLFYFDFIYSLTLLQGVDSGSTGLYVLRSQRLKGLKVW